MILHLTIVLDCFVVIGVALSVKHHSASQPETPVNKNNVEFIFG